MFTGPEYTTGREKYKFKNYKLHKRAFFVKRND